MLVPNIHLDINSVTNPQIPLIENSLGDLSKKMYYQPETLSKDTYALYNLNPNFNEISFKETEKTILSGDNEYLSELYSILIVREYIKQHNLETSLLESINRINSYFDNPIIKFEFTIDIEEGFETLFVYIITPLTTREASITTRKMYKGWNLLKETNFRKHITLITRNINAFQLA
jgi:hypothetical protein